MELIKNGQPETPQAEPLRKTLAKKCPVCEWILKLHKLITIEASGVVLSRIDIDDPAAIMEIQLHWFMVQGRVYTHSAKKFGDFRQDPWVAPLAAAAVLQLWSEGANMATPLPPWIASKLKP